MLIIPQDDRDIRESLKAQGLEPAYSFMIRVRMPGGICSAKQWLDMDRIADEHGNGTFKLTTRQTFQFHGVIKSHLKKAMQAINKSLLDTIAACGDVSKYSFPSLPFWSLLFINDDHTRRSSYKTHGVKARNPFFPGARSESSSISLLLGYSRGLS